MDEKKPTKHYKLNRKETELPLVRVTREQHDRIWALVRERQFSSYAAMILFDYCQVTPETIGVNDEGKEILIVMQKMAMILDKFTEAGMTEEVREFMKAATQKLNDRKK